MASTEGIGQLSRSTQELLEDPETDRLLIAISYSEIAIQSLFKLPFYGDHSDPFDRMLIATALSESVPLVSSDKQFKRYRGLRVIR